ncbi:MAG: multidrug transporter AcrB [Bacillales bacterium]|nr:multidrug transporter AcrB [Bacillales bacterium]
MCYHFMVTKFGRVIIIMSWLTKWSFKNKAAVSIMSLLILLLGVISYFRLPMEFLPPADQPFISIVTIGQGVDSNTMEIKLQQ